VEPDYTNLDGILMSEEKPMITYAIIPARGGSKGIHNKNLSTVGGRSLIEIGVSTCMGAKEVSKVFVSTDHSGIMLEAKRFGANVIERPADLASDTSSSESALLHAIDEIEKQGHDKPDTILFYQITNPFTTSDDIDNAYSHFIKSQADSLFTSSLFTHFLWERKDGKISPINHDCAKRLRRQEISNCFVENGAFFLMNTEGFVKSKHRFFGKIEMFEMGNINIYDIDNQCDLDIANLLSNGIR